MPDWTYRKSLWTHGHCSVMLCSYVAIGSAANTRHTRRDQGRDAPLRVTAGRSDTDNAKAAVRPLTVSPSQAAAATPARPRASGAARGARRRQREAGRAAATRRRRRERGRAAATSSGPRARWTASGIRHRRPDRAAGSSRAAGPLGRSGGQCLGRSYRVTIDAADRVGIPAAVPENRCTGSGRGRRDHPPQQQGLVGGGVRDEPQRP
jgi:hypothetical protein